MHHTTAKLITLERAEAFLAHHWPEGAQAAFAAQACTLRQEIPVHMVAAYDHLKAEHKVAVVGVADEKCGGCHEPLSTHTLARLNDEREVIRCEQCGRFLYRSCGHNLGTHEHSHPHHTGQA